MTRLLETMRADDGTVALLDRHLDRLAHSARVFGWSLNLGAVRRRAEAEPVGAGAWGVRLTVGPGSDIESRSWPLDGVAMRVAWLDPEPFPEAGSLRCVHKTTDRDHYRRRYDRARARGADEALLVAPSGQVSEGTRTSVWALADGVWRTPPLADGGLPGVQRGHLLDTRADCAVAPLTPQSLRLAEAVALSNALRGWMPVRLLDPSRPSGVQASPSTPPDP